MDFTHARLQVSWAVEGSARKAGHSLDPGLRGKASFLLPDKSDMVLNTWFTRAWWDLPRLLSVGMGSMQTHAHWGYFFCWYLQGGFGTLASFEKTCSGGFSSQLPVTAGFDQLSCTVRPNLCHRVLQLWKISLTKLQVLLQTWQLGLIQADWVLGLYAFDCLKNYQIVLCNLSCYLYRYSKSLVTVT